MKLWPVPPQLSANELGVALTLSLKSIVIGMFAAACVAVFAGVVETTVGAASVEVNEKT